MAAGGGSRLGAGGVALLSIGFVAASVVVFVFGIRVGKDLAERRLAHEERVVRGAVERLTPPQGAVGDPALTFYEHWRGGTPRPDGRSATPRPSSTATPTPRARQTATPTAEPPRASPTKAAQPPRPTPNGRAPADEWADAGWTVQVAATTDPAEAARMVERLKSKGYEAYVIRVPARGQTWHRVRVGNSVNRAGAKALEDRLRSEGWEGAFVTAR